MSAAGNVEIIERLYAEFLSVPERLASPEGLDFFDPQVQLEQSASVLGTEGIFHGYGGLARAARELFGSYRDLHWLPQKLEAVGDDVVVAVVDSRARGRTSDVEVSYLTIHTWTLRAGRVVRWHVRFPHVDPAGSPSE